MEKPENPDQAFLNINNNYTSPSAFALYVLLFQALVTRNTRVKGQKNNYHYCSYIAAWVFFFFFGFFLFAPPPRCLSAKHPEQAN